MELERRTSNLCQFEKSKLFFCMLALCVVLFVCLLSLSAFGDGFSFRYNVRPGAWVASDGGFLVSTVEKRKTGLPCKSTHFSKVLLVVTFNFQFYGNIEVLNKLYGDVFGGIYYCGPTGNSESHPDVHEFNLRSGYYGYVCMAKAIQAKPGFKGYIYTNDDIIINWWNLVGYNLNRVWQGPKIVDFTQDAYVKEHNRWVWWDTDMGLKSCQRVYEHLLNLTKKKNSDSGIFKEALINYLDNGGNRPRCGKGWSDFFYVPARLAPLASELLMLCYNEHLFLEMSVTNVIRMLSKMEDVEILNGLFLPDVGVYNSANGEAFWTHFNTNVTFIHPFKLNSGLSDKLNNAVVQILVRLGQAELKQNC